MLKKLKKYKTDNQIKFDSQEWYAKMMLPNTNNEIMNYVHVNLKYWYK